MRAQTQRRQASGLVARPDLLLVAAIVAFAGALTGIASSDDGRDDLARAVSQLPWPAIGAGLVLPVLMGIHYLCAAFALRAVSGRRLALLRTTSVQLAAAAANRVIPNGIGGAGVNLRYLLRAGSTPGAASSSLAALALVGGATDAAYTATVTALGPTVGLLGAAHELRTLTAGGLRAGQQHYWVVIAALAIVAVVSVVRMRGDVVTGLASGARQSLTHAWELARRPRRLAVAAAASAATTVVLSVGFLVAVSVWGHAANALPAGAIVAIYLVASAVGGAAPLPAFFGVTEASLIGGLVLGGYSPTSALISVVIFRGLTFWLPLPVGVVAARRLLRANAL
jgi:uncharacterized membrane protein YbhN (UPF0104 family)